MQRGTYGFWRGVAVGIVATLAAAFVAAWAFPPLGVPAVDDTMQVPPAPPGAPRGGDAAAPLLPPAPGPIVDGLPTAPARPEADAPDAPAGSPSLVPAGH